MNARIYIDKNGRVWVKKSGEYTRKPLVEKHFVPTYYEPYIKI